MKILAEITDDPSLDIGVLQNASKALGHQWAWLDRNRYACFDAFYEFRPDVFITPTKVHADAQQCIEKYKPKHIMQEGYSSYKVGDAQLNLPCVDEYTFFKDAALDFQYDVVFCHTKNCPVGPYLLNKCYPLGKNKVVIFGPARCPLVQYIGRVSIDYYRQLYSNTRYVAVYSQHEALKAIACGATPLALTDLQFTRTIGKELTSTSVLRTLLDA